MFPFSKSWDIKETNVSYLSVKAKVLYLRYIKGDYRWGVLPLLEFSSNRRGDLLIMKNKRPMEANLQWLLALWTIPFIWESCIYYEGKRVVLELPVFTACLSKWACGGLRGHNRSNHTQWEEFRNPWGPLNVMRFYNYCFIYDYCCCHCCARKHVYTLPQTDIYIPWHRVMRVYYYCWS